MTLLGVLIGVILLIGLAVVLGKPRPEAPPENTHKISRSTISAPKSGDAARILARMKTMAAPTLLMKAAASGFSKLGGDPELPRGMDWPIGPDGALAFLAQVDLAAARDAGGPDWLPPKGALYVFGDERFGMRDQIRIVFSTAEAGPHCEPPANQKRGWRRPERRVGFSAHPSLPSLDWLGEDVREIDLSDGDLEELSDLPGLELGDAPHHRLGGYPIEIQEEQLPISAEYEARGLESRASTPVPPDIEQAAADWRMLIQIDSDPGLKMNWGDGGQFYVLIREQDARAGDFSQTVTLSQTY
jgi:uncharacterized protein YwqG